MNPQRPPKRKSPSSNVVFEVSDNDVSPEHSDSDSHEPEAKIFKPQSTFVESVVNALAEIADLDSDAVAVCSEPVVESSSESNKTTIIQNEDDETNTLLSTCSERCIVVSSDDKVSKSPQENCINEVVDVVEVQEKSEEILPEAIEKEDEKQMTEEIVQNIDSIMNDDEEMTQETDNKMKELLAPEQNIRISFSDEEMSEIYKFRFLKFLEKFVEFEVDCDDKLNLTVKRDTLLNPREWVVLDATMCSNENVQNSSTPIELPPKDKTLKKKKKKAKAKKEKGLFVLDINPSADETNTSLTYSSKFNIDSNVDDEEQDAMKVSAQTCFNCDGNHSLKDCNSPKDFGRISAKRQKFKAYRQVSRYHLEDDQKYSHLVPGKISGQLREALGLRKNQLPFFIYKMRVLGYPPGWLEEAKSVKSNLNMFDADGKNVRQTVKQKQGLDPEKIVDYPGFNVPFEKSFEDEFRQHRVPPYSDHYSKQVMLDYFNKLFVQDDEIDVNVDSPIDNSSSPVHDIRKAVSPVLAGESMDNDNSITELVKQKEILLEALQDNSTSDVRLTEQNNGTKVADDDNSQSANTNEDTVCDISQSALSILVSDTLIDEVNEDCALSPVLKNRISCIRESCFGTPILKSGSRYSVIPKSDNFMKDVSPVINFENLPNSTGKYEQMTNVLQKVRKTMKEKQNCES